MIDTLDSEEHERVVISSEHGVGRDCPPSQNIRIHLSLVLPLHHLNVSLLSAITILSCLLDEAYSGRYEIILVGGSEDDTSYPLAQKLAAYYPHLRLLSKHEKAHQLSMSGLWKIAKGNVVGVIAAHLQDAPEVILQLLAKLNAGYDVAIAKRASWGSDIFSWALTHNAPNQDPSTVSGHLFAQLLGVMTTPDQSCFLARRFVMQQLNSQEFGPAAMDWSIYRNKK